MLTPVSTDSLVTDQSEGFINDLQTYTSTNTQKWATEAEPPKGDTHLPHVGCKSYNVAY